MSDKAIEELQAEIKKLSEQVTASALEREQREAKLKEYEERLAAAQKELEKLHEERRAERIARKVEELKIPALRPYLRACYELAASSDVKLRLYSEDGKSEERDAEAIIDEMVDRINEVTEPLLKEMSISGAGSRAESEPEDDPAKEVDRRVIEYMEKHKDADYASALRAVLDADPELKKAYASAA